MIWLVAIVFALIPWSVIASTCGWWIATLCIVGAAIVGVIIGIVCAFVIPLEKRTRNDKG
jgi:hypothetical protein